MIFDFDGLNAFLKSRIREVLPAWLPGGKLSGREYEVASLNGGAGKSLKVNLDSTLWSDFADGHKGKDLISLFAAIERTDQAGAYKRLAEQYHFNNSTQPGSNGHAPRLVIPPKGVTPPSDFSLGSLSPTKVWEYKGKSGNILFYVARYDMRDGKEFRPWSFTSENTWTAKAWTDDRPLYGLELLENKEKPVLVVEGEKAADAARKLQSAYIVVSWMSGSNAVAKTDWRPLRGRKILLWPDADRKLVKEGDNVWTAKGFKPGDVIPYSNQPGFMAMEQISKLLYPYCPEIKMINVSTVKEDGWDAADALKQGWDFGKFIEWAKPLVDVLKPIPVSVTPLDSLPVVVKEEVEKTIKFEVQKDEPPINMSHYAVWSAAGVQTTKGGQIIINADNLLKLLRHLPFFKDLIWWDEFHAKIFTRWNSVEPRAWKDTDETNVAAYFQRELGLHKLKENDLRRALFAFAETNIRNEPRDWMDSLTWDTVPRLEFFFPEYMGTDDNDYTQAASKNFWISMVARTYKPGCKCDNMVILEGGQGKFKSTALEVIAGKWFAETNEAPTNKDFFLTMQGKLLLEVGELDAFSKADFKTIKKVLSCNTDNYRPPYGHHTKAFPRQSIFCGSTNDEEYLDDPTGGRRFWPLKIGNILLEKIKEDREQLFAEAVSRFKAGETWWEMPESAANEQENRRQSDEWEEILQRHLSVKASVSLTDLANDALNIKPIDLTRPIQLRIGRILKLLGWQKKVKRIDGTKHKRWERS